MALTLDEANRVLEATLAKAKQLNIKVSAAVVRREIRRQFMGCWVRL